MNKTEGEDAEKMSIVGAVLFFVVVVGFASAMMVITHRTEKRGCGRGCATCGNRDICYRKQKEAGDK